MVAQRAPILLTKLSPPIPRPDWVQRDRLFRRLDQVFDRTCALVAAPAGYGKSALLAGWFAARQQQRPDTDFLWLTLDSSDYDPVRFLSSLFAAITPAILPVELRDDLQEALQAPQLTQTHETLTALVNALARQPRQMVMVIDDLHLAAHPIISTSLAFLIEHLPAALHLVLASRVEPDLPLARWRARGLLVELRTADLRFDSVETTRFFTENRVLPLNDAQIERLNQRAEGWVASLQLAALSLANTPDPQAFIDSFSGADRNVVDYLTEEVLAQQPPEIQSFLLRTAVLDRLCADLCAWVLSDAANDFTAEGVQQTLIDLERLNLFLSPLDNHRLWFRYHPLFADLLHQRLKQTQPALLPILHLRAAHWLTQHDQPFEAFHHAIAAQAYHLAAELIDQNLPFLVEHAENVHLRSLLDVFPEEEVLSHPALCLGRAWNRLYDFDFVQAEKWATQPCLQTPAALARNDLQGQAAALLATVAINLKNAPAAIVHARRSLALLPEENQWKVVRGLLYLNLGDAQAAADEGQPALDAFIAALDIAHRQGNRIIETIIIGSLGNQYLRMGQLRQAESVLRQAEELEQGRSSLLAAGKPLCFLARVYLERHEIPQARRAAAAALERCLQWHHPDHLFDAWMIQAEVDWLAANPRWMDSVQSARDLLRHWRAALSSAATSEFLDRYEQSIHHFLARVHLRAADGRSAAQELSAAGDSDSLLNALAALYAGQTQTALDIVARQRHLPWPRQRVQSAFVEALAHRQAGRVKEARAALQAALRLARPEGLLAPIFDCGPLGFSFLKEAARDLPANAEPEERAALTWALAAFDLYSPDAPKAPSSEALSERERQILRLVAAGRGNAEIAAELILSTNTVKTHLKRIFEKLGAASRTEAVHVARLRGWV